MCCTCRRGPNRVADSRFAEVTSAWPTTCSKTAPVQRLKATRKTPAGDMQSGCLSPSVLPALSLHVEKPSSVSLMIPVQGLPQRARLVWSTSHVEEKITQNETGHATEAPLSFRFHLRQRTVPVLLHLPCASARLSRQPSGSSGELHRDPPLLGILFESSAHLHTAQIVKFYSSLCLLLLSRTKQSALASWFSPDFWHLQAQLLQPFPAAV